MISILLVDDDKSLQNVYQALFPLGNFEISAQAFDGVEAIALYKRLDKKPDVIIMDQRMPRMDGITATKKLKEIYPSVKIIFLSADDDSQFKAMKAGASVFLTKPVRIETLFGAIEKIVND